ncbi:hypothetical protein EBZ39_09070 [bacterium]|nr:hypothetical protein [bacterium]
MTTDMMRKVTDAIEQSMREDRTADVTASSIDDVLDSIGAEWEHDSVDLGDGTYDVWGWSSAAAENQHEWRLLVTVSEAAVQTETYEWTVRTEAGMTVITAPNSDAAAVAWAVGEGLAEVHDLDSLIAHIEDIPGAWLWIESTMAPDGERVYAGRQNMPR